MDSLVTLAVARSGLRFMQLGIVSALCTIVATIWAQVTGQILVEENGILWLLGFGIVVPSLLFFLGSCLNMAAPGQSGARKFAGLMVVFSGIQLALVLVAIPLAILMAFIGMLAIAPALLLHVCFAFYMNRLCQYLHRENLVKATGWLLRGVVVVPLTLSGISSVAHAAVPQLTPQQVGLIWLAGGLMFAVWYTILISSVCKALRVAHVDSDHSIDPSFSNFTGLTQATGTIQDNFYHEGEGGI